MKHPKCNVVSWLQVHCCVLRHALAIHKWTVLGGVFDSQGLRKKKYYNSNSWNCPSVKQIIWTVCSIIHVSTRNPSFQISVSWKCILGLQNQLKLLSVGSNGQDCSLHAKRMTSKSSNQDGYETSLTDRELLLETLMVQQHYEQIEMHTNITYQEGSDKYRRKNQSELEMSW